MSIDAVIEGIRRKEHTDVLTLRGREPHTQPGRRILHVTRNPDYAPQVNDAIWGGAHQCMIVGPDGTDHEVRRIMRLWDGTEKVL